MLATAEDVAGRSALCTRLSPVGCGDALAAGFVWRGCAATPGGRASVGCGGRRGKRAFFQRGLLDSQTVFNLAARTQMSADRL